VPLVDIIAEDVAYYASAGVRGTSCLLFGSYSLGAYGVNVEAYARGVSGSPGARDAFVARRYGPDARAMAEYLAALERLMRGVVADGDVLLPPRSGAPAARIRDAHARTLAGASRVRALLPATPRAAVDRCLFEYTVATIAALHDYVAARLAQDHALAEQALVALSTAREHLGGARDALGTWAAYDLEMTQGFFMNALREG
jgi:hypothetical protein